VSKVWAAALATGDAQRKKEGAVTVGLLQSELSSMLGLPLKGGFSYLTLASPRSIATVHRQVSLI